MADKGPHHGKSISGAPRSTLKFSIYRLAALSLKFTICGSSRGFKYGEIQQDRVSEALLYIIATAVVF